MDLPAVNDKQDTRFSSASWSGLERVAADRLLHGMEGANQCSDRVLWLDWACKWKDGTASPIRD